MNIISFTKTAPLHPFRIAIRDKKRIKAFLYDLNVQMFGWNLPSLFHKYFAGVDTILSEDYHRVELLKLISTLISIDNEVLVNDPAAIVHDQKINTDLVFTFLTSFVTKLQDRLCEELDISQPALPSKEYSRELHMYMTSIVYSEMRYKNPAAGSIVAFLLLVLANIYPIAFCETPASEIVKDIVHRINPNQMQSV